MMIFGEERLFITDTLPSEQNYREFFLKYLGIDSMGLKMTGDFPKLWFNNKRELKGPDIFDEDYLYKIIMVDYEQKLIWLVKIP